MLGLGCEVAARGTSRSVLTYMSTPEILLNKCEELVATQQLFKLEPLVRDELSYTRSLWVTFEVLEVINSTGTDDWTASRHREFEASLDAFINWEEISVSEDPFYKGRETFLARVHPVNLEFWDIRTIEPPQGMRCLGAFIGQDEFVALVCDYRENYDWGEFDRLVERCRAQWKLLFGTLTPHSGDSLDAYLTKYYLT